VQLNIGDNLGPYEILAPIGEGGMGEVWKARDTRLDRIVAIKCSKSAFTERFEREARAVASLNHPNICQLYDVGPNYLVMEYIDGPHLQGPMPVDKAVEIAAQILDALDAAHRKRITHRDLKPANIILTRQGIKLLDFGLAKLEEAPLAATDATLVAAATSKGEIVGTLQYMAPEQLQSKPVDARSDLFSFGCVLYELLTGRQAFSGESAASIIASILEREPAPTNLPAPLDRILKTCLEKDPGKRFQNALDLKRALQWALDQRQQSAPPPRAAKSVPLWAAVGLLLLAVAGGLAYNSGRKAEQVLKASPLIRVTRDGQSTMPALSPDGKLLAFASIREGNSDIYVQQAGGTVPIRVTDDPAYDGQPAFSADGTKIYFSSNREPNGVYEVPALGGDARLFQAGATDPTPSPDGKLVAMSLGKLAIKPVAGGELRELFVLTATPHAWSPDSSQLIVRVREPFTQFHVVSIDGSSRPLKLESNLIRRNMYNGQWSNVAAWLPDQTLLFTSPLGDAVNVWRIALGDVESGEPAPVIFGTSSNSLMFTSAVPGRIAFNSNHSVNRLLSLACDLNNGKVHGVPQHLTTGQSDGLHPYLSPDGSLLAYSSRKNGSQALWLRDLRTGKERMLAQPKSMSEALAHFVFSPDGKRIAATYSGEGGTGGQGPAAWKMVTIDAATGERSALSDSGARLRGWSPDGRFLLLWETSVPQGVSVMDMASRKKYRIVVRGQDQFTDPKLSADGQWLAFLDGARRLYVAPFRGDKAIPESEWRAIADNAGFPFWAPDGNSIYFAPGSAGTPRGTLLRQALHPQTKQPVGQPSHFYTFEFGLPVSVVNPIAVSTDRIVVVISELSTDIWTMNLR